HGGAAEGDAGVGQGALDEHLAPDIGRGDERVQPVEIELEAPAHLTGGETGDQAADDGRFGVGGQVVHLAGEALGVEAVVGVHPGDETGAAGGEAAVEGGDDSAVGLVY